MKICLREGLTESPLELISFFYHMVHSATYFCLEWMNHQSNLSPSTRSHPAKKPSDASAAVLNWLLQWKTLPRGRIRKREWQAFWKPEAASPPLIATWAERRKLICHPNSNQFSIQISISLCFSGRPKERPKVTPKFMHACAQFKNETFPFIFFFGVKLGVNL